MGRVAFTSQGTRQRIVSLAPSVTSILLALGARRQLVAVSKWCKDVADVNGLPELGDCWSFGVKQEGAAEQRAAVMKLKPTLVVGSVPFKAETVEKILALPVPFLALNPRSLADVKADIGLLGQMTNANAQAKALIREMERKFDRLRDITKKAKRLRVYCEAWPHPRISSPPWVAELVKIAGGEMNVRAGERVSDRDVARADPEVIVLAWAATGEKSKAKQALENPAWKDVGAVRSGKVFVIRDELLNTPGPPLVCGTEELLRVIHPELAGEALRHGGKRAHRGS